MDILLEIQYALISGLFMWSIIFTASNKQWWKTKENKINTIIAISFFIVLVFATIFYSIPAKPHYKTCICYEVING